MNQIEFQEEKLWIDNPNALNSGYYVDGKFDELIKKSYHLLENPEDSVFYSNNDNAKIYTYLILANEAVLRNDMLFFLKISKLESLSFHGCKVIKTIWETQRFEFYEAIQSKIKCVNNYIEDGYFEDVLNVTLKYYSKDEILNELSYISNIQLANALINKEFPFLQVVCKCNDKLKALLTEEQI